MVFFIDVISLILPPYFFLNYREKLNLQKNKPLPSSQSLFSTQNNTKNRRGSSENSQYIVVHCVQLFGRLKNVVLTYVVPAGCVHVSLKVVNCIVPSRTIFESNQNVRSFFT